MTQDKPFKSSRHAALALEDQATERARVAREIARAFARPMPPRVRSQRPGWLARCLRAFLAWL